MWNAHFRNKNGGIEFSPCVAEMLWCRFDMKCGLHVVWKCIFSDNNFLLSQITSRIPLWPRPRYTTRGTRIPRSTKLYKYMARKFLIRSMPCCHDSDPFRDTSLTLFISGIQPIPSLFNDFINFLLWLIIMWYFLIRDKRHFFYLFHVYFSFDLNYSKQNFHVIFVLES